MTPLSQVFVRNIVVASVLAAAAAISAEDAPLHLFEFEEPPSKPVYEWLAEQDFLLERHAANRKRIELYHADGAMHVRVKRPSFGLVVHELDVPQARHLELSWGISKYPAGASYQHA